MENIVVLNEQQFAVCPWNPTRSAPLLDLRSGTTAPKTPI